MAHKKLHAANPGDLLAFETDRLLTATSMLQLVAAREMARTLAFLPTMRPDHRRASCSPVQRNLDTLQWLAEHPRFSALNLADPDKSPLLRGFPISGPIPLTGLWPKARKLSQNESAILLSDPAPVWPVNPPHPWEDPQVIRQGWEHTKTAALPTNSSIVRQLGKSPTPSRSRGGGFRMGRAGELSPRSA